MRILLSIFVMLIFSACSHAKNDNCTSKNCIFDKNICLNNKDDNRIIIFGKKEYPSVSYYSDIEIKKISNNKFQIINNYSDKSPIIIYSNFLLKDGELNLSSIKAVSYPNISPKGAKQVCSIEINKIFDKPLETYIDNKIFDLSEKEKLKICRLIRNND